MRIIDKIIYWFFSLIILILSILIIFLTLNMFGVAQDIAVIPYSFLDFIEKNPKPRHITLIISTITLLLAIKGMFFQSRRKKVDSDGVLLENASGKLSISKDTLESIVRNITYEEDGLESINPIIYLDNNNNLIVRADVVVEADANIKNISLSLQEQIKQNIKFVTDLDVSNVDINVQNISNKKNRKNRKTYKETKEIKMLKKENEKLEKVAEEKEKENIKLKQQNKNILKQEENKKEIQESKNNKLDNKQDKKENNTKEKSELEIVIK